MKLIDADKLKEAFCIVFKKFNTNNPHKEVIMSVINTEPAVLLSCPKCHGKGVYEVAVFDEENEVWTGEAENVHCELCYGTGKVTLEFYESIQKASRRNEAH